jgi:hypothetical protein
VREEGKIWSKEIINKSGIRIEYRVIKGLIWMD